MSGVEMIAEERYRQLHSEGHTPEHDDALPVESGELSWAASALAGVASALVRGASLEEFPYAEVVAEGDWPGNWPAESWKPDPDPIVNLVRAGALVAAEIDRLLRARAKGGV